MNVTGTCAKANKIWYQRDIIVSMTTMWIELSKGYQWWKIVKSAKGYWQRNVFNEDITGIISISLKWRLHIWGPYRSISQQIPRCIGQISHNIPLCNRNVHMCAHFCYKVVHCGIWDWCTVGFVWQVNGHVAQQTSNHILRTEQTDVIQQTFQISFTWKKIFIFCFIFHWSLLISI